ncbi:single-stranded DNA-binding protein [Rhodoferax mekongensis]|uniref:Single-stranded DNA-binding protein n=1 Tax=Rhodoferax mekongensis TaxID=3068341 RepID=A0ABZ0B4H8_9BURK|nr:single-stranded DNA-binding protein [Rhodoferax sp. TBRC 17307]WNO05974.1 single-stranded DNA-binding protein [Rhodoferax sp. TBRC 17307]
MASVNKVILIGNCGRDPEVRYLPSGQAVANVSLATTSRRKDRQTGDTIEDTQWHRITFYEKLAEIVGDYVKKGDPIYIEGRLKYGKYTDNSGVEKNTCDIVATEMKMLGSRDRQDQGQGQDQGGQQPQGRGQQQRQAPPQRGGQAPRGAQQPARQAPARPSSGFDDMDDDIPY